MNHPTKEQRNPTPRTAANGQLIFAALGLILLAPGCRTLNNAQAKLQSQKRFSQVRSRVKQQMAQQQLDGAMFETAVETITESIAMDPTQRQSYVILARANLELGKTGAARTAIDTAHRAGLEDPMLDYLNGVILELHGNMKTAVDHYASAHETDHDDIDFRVAYAECLVALDRPEEALAVVTENTDYLDDDGTLSALAAHIALLTADTDLATEHFIQALAVQPDSRIVAEELGRLLVKAGRYQQALSVLTPMLTTVDQHPAPGEIIRAIASCNLAQDNPASAKRVLLDYVRQHPKDSVAQVLLAKSALATGDMMTALRAVDEAQQSGPGLPEFWLVRATANWKRGKFSRAASDLYDVLQNDPNDVQARCLLAEVLRDQRQLDGAREQFQTALRIDPTCNWATAGLESLAKAEPSPKATTARLTSATDPASADRPDP